jgi:peptidoglycan/xylan/chitin deacetylase (PgdA/CDA1 family)
MPRLIFGGNFAVRREALAKIGGFDTSINFYGEDADLSKRISKVGEIFFLKRLSTTTSARRYIREGLLQTNLNYILNYFSVLWCDHPIHSKKFSFVLRWTLSLAFLGLLIAIILSLYVPTDELAGHVIYQLPTQDKVVALTFDDGPNGQYTQTMLDILDKENVRATFFMVGKNVERYPELAREIIKKGHHIGNHSYSHPWRLPFENKQSIWSEIIKTDDAIFQATGQRPKIFRPPHGLRTPWMIKELHEAGYTIYTWDDMTDDYVVKTKPETIIKNILEHVQPGAIIVLHDGLNLDHTSSRANTIQALPIIIESLKKQGYSFVTL